MKLFCTEFLLAAHNSIYLKERISFPLKEAIMSKIPTKINQEQFEHYISPYLSKGYLR
jgi:hypothetical protein